MQEGHRVLRMDSTVGPTNVLLQDPCPLGLRGFVDCSFTL